ncbi:MAG: ATP-binding protein [Planctomycetota bacterium]
MKKPPLSMFSTENFKAIQKSGRINFGWLTCFIGNNGVGKSSLVEAIETFRDVALEGVDAAFRRWRGFEHVWNKARTRQLLERRDHRPGFSHPLRFEAEWRSQRNELFKFKQSITQGPGGNSLFIQEEHVTKQRFRWSRDDSGVVFDQDDKSHAQKAPDFIAPFADGESLLKKFAWDSFERWQFLLLNPDRMGQPSPEQRATRVVKLARDGANVAEYLNEIHTRNPAAFDGLLDALRYVLPYAVDLRPSFTSELERAFYLKLKEETYEVPGWLLSTGTLRIVALLACLRHPEPPPLLVIEEIENGLDPRTLHLVVEEIRAAITAGTTQVILTTHSPYLLDLLDLSHIVVVEREEGQPVFRRPDAEQLAEWSKSFSPGRLYTMGRLTRGDQ